MTDRLEPPADASPTEGIRRPDLAAALEGCRFAEIRAFPAIGSTNTWLAGRAREGAADGLVAVAGEQLAGRGRMGRTWVAPAGSALLMSVLVRPRQAPEHWPLLSFAMALAAIEAMAAEGAGGAALKWPNDVIVPAAGDRKLAGILAELVVPSGGTPAAGHGGVEGGAVIVGMGCNVTRPAVVDAEVADRAMWLDQCGARVGVDALLVAVLRAFDRRVSQFEAGASGAAAMLADYRGACTTIGREVRVELADAVLHGTATGVDDDGRLLVATKSATGTGTVALSAGDVVHVRPG